MEVFPWQIAMEHEGPGIWQEKYCDKFHQLSENETQLLVGNAIISFIRTIIGNLVLYENAKYSSVSSGETNMVPFSISSLKSLRTQSVRASNNALPGFM